MKLKKGFVQFFICFVFFWAIFDMITFREDFPFAPYSMYSNKQDTVGRTIVKAFAVDRAGGETDLANVNFYPWDEARYNMMLNTKWYGPNGKTAVASAFRDTLETCAKDGGHMEVFKDTKYVGLRLYRLQWPRLTVANRENPGERTLLVEYFKKQ